MSKKVKNTHNSTSQEKLELAQKIAANSTQKVANTYASMENAFIYIFRWISSLLTKVFFSEGFSKIFALVLAIVLYVSVNANTGDSFITQSAVLNNIPVNVTYNSEIYEVSGIPSSVNVIVSGDMSDIALQKGKTNSNCVVDLSGLTEGQYSIKIVPNNFSSALSVNVLDTPTVNVTIKKKITTKYNISYEFINSNKMSGMYTLGAPVFDTTEVLIRASQDTIDSISFVKALIDVTGVTSTFTTDAKVVAYDNNGSIVECDIIPSTVSATVTVTTPSKEVPIIVRPIGTMVEDLAIDAISLDHSSVTIYAANSVLSMIDAVYIDLDISSITKDMSYSTTLNTPSGVTNMSVNKVNMEITVEERVTKTIKDVKLSWFNNTMGFKVKVVNDADATLDVIITGTRSNVEKVTAEDISIAIDLSNITTTGIHQAPLVITGSKDFITYMIENDMKYVDIEIAN